MHILTFFVHKLSFMCNGIKAFPSRTLFYYMTISKSTSCSPLWEGVR